MAMRDRPTSTFLVEALNQLECLENKLRDLPEDAESDRHTLQAAIKELREMINRHVA